jgi:uncharacterized protein YegP (UPF0339 family)
MKKRKAKFATFTGNDGQFYFTYIGKNGEPMATSEGYKTKAARTRAANSIKRDAADADIVERG